ncbi:MAG: hypothetical protein AABX38_01780 [Candidatus Micrarchaeota archaeon]
MAKDFNEKSVFVSDILGLNRTEVPYKKITSVELYRASTRLGTLVYDFYVHFDSKTRYIRLSLKEGDELIKILKQKIGEEKVVDFVKTVTKTSINSWFKEGVIFIFAILILFFILKFIFKF